MFHLLASFSLGSGPSVGQERYRALPARAKNAGLMAFTCTSAEDSESDVRYINLSN